MKVFFCELIILRLDFFAQIDTAIRELHETGGKQTYWTNNII